MAHFFSARCSLASTRLPSRWSPVPVDIIDKKTSSNLVSHMGQNVSRRLLCSHRRQENEEPAGPLDQLPQEWVEQVMQRLLIADVFVCKSVCKTWKAAAEFVVATRRSLTLMSKKAMEEEGGDMDTIAVPKKKKKKAVAKSLMQMTGVESIDVHHICNKKMEQLAQTVIGINASHLKSLMCGWDLSMTAMPIQLPALQQLLCVSLDAERVAACPELRYLAVVPTGEAPTAFFSSLSAVNMVSLVCEFDESPTPGDMVQMLAEVARLVNLTVLRLTYLRDEEEEEENWDPHHSVLKLFDHLTHLVEVRINLPAASDDLVADPLIQTLVNQNPMLRLVIFSGVASLTNASLLSLSRLTGLRRLGLDMNACSGVKHTFTTSGMLTLLRGGSRHVLDGILLHCLEEPDADEIRSELDQMSQETHRPSAMSCSIEHNIFGHEQEDGYNAGVDDRIRWWTTKINI